MGIPEKIFICGAKGSGKTEFAKLLSVELKSRSLNGDLWAVAECSSSLIGRLAEMLVELDATDMLSEFTGLGEKGSLVDWAKVILRDKERFRPALRRLGDRLAKESPGLLLTEATENGRIVVGARRREEVNGFYALRRMNSGYGAQAPWANHCWVLVKRPNAPIQADFDEVFFNTQCGRHVVFNVGSLDGLKEQAARLAEELTHGS